jgi:phytoene dehydrogenase-like protein
MKPFDVIVVGAGLGGLTAAALLSRAGRRTLVLERNAAIGGAASTYKVGDLMVEGSLHETSDPRDPIDPKNAILDRIGVLDALTWVPTGAVYEVRGGPVGRPFVLPDGFDTARAALFDRFPSSRSGAAAILGDLERIASGLGILSRRREAFRDPRRGVAALLKLAPLVKGWHRSVAETFDRAFGDDEAAKCALGANLAYWHDDPKELWWILFAVAQGGYLASGSRYVRGGSRQLSNSLAAAVQRAGGEILVGRQAAAIRLDGAGRPCAVLHQDGNGGDPSEASAPIVVANAAPAVVAGLLPDAARARFWSAYAVHRPSISLFSVTFGLSVRPATLGFTSYSTFLLPPWMKALSDQSRSVELLASLPGEQVPVLAVVDYSAIDSGLGGPPYPVSVVGVDRVEHWSALDRPAYDAKRQAWERAIVAAVDREFPGFAAQRTVSVFNTALTMQTYLNAPHGAVYGFAPLPPGGPLWRGPGRSTKTPVAGLYLASAYAGSGGFTGAILAGGNAADAILDG